MPMLRAPLVALVVPALCGPGRGPLPSESHLTPAAALLPRFAARAGAPDAALLAHDASSAPRDTYRSTGPGIRYADRFRAGSVTKSFVAVVVLQLAGERRLRLSDPVERFLPGLIRGRGNDGTSPTSPPSTRAPRTRRAS